MTATFSFSFEFDTAPPLTWRGTVVGPSILGCSRLALKQALAALPEDPVAVLRAGCRA